MPQLLFQISKLLLLFTMALTTYSASAQAAAYCEQLRQSLQLAHKNNNFSLVDFYYHKILNTCAVSDQDKSLVAEVASNNGYSIKWTLYDSYTIEAFSDKEIDYTTFNQYRQFDDLPLSHPIRAKYGTLEKLTNSINIDLNELPQHPLILADEDILMVMDYGYTKLYDLRTNKWIKTFDEQIYAVQYVGNQTLQAFTDRHTEIYKYQRSSKGIELKKIIDRTGHANIIPIRTDAALIIFYDTNGDDGITIYDDKGKLLKQGIQYIDMQPLSRTMLLHLNNRQQLINYEMKTIIPNAVSIEEMWIDNAPHYLAELSTNKYGLYTIQGKAIQSFEFLNMMSLKGELALVTHEGKTGILALKTKNWQIPLQQQQLITLCPGYFAIGNAYQWKIVDDAQHVLSTNAYKTVKYLTDKGSLRLLVQNKDGHYGVIDAWANVLVPTQYKQINFIENTHQIELIHYDNTKTLVNINGQ